MSMTTFEEVIDASKNINLEIQRKHGRYGVGVVEVISKEEIPQNLLQKIFSRPKVRVIGQFITETPKKKHDISGKEFLETKDVHPDKIRAIIENIFRTEMQSEKAVFNKNSYQGLERVYKILRCNDFSSTFIDDFTNYVVNNLTLHELRDAVIMENILKAYLERQILFYDEPKESELSQRIITLIGPTGVGKTTLISKLAVRLFVNRLDSKKAKDPNKNMHLRIMSLDAFKVGAVDQIQKIANVLDVPCKCAGMTDNEEVKKYVKEGSRPEILLVDTMGQNIKETEDACSVTDILLSLKKNNIIFLVIDASIAEKNIEQIFKKFLPYKYSGVIITKLDEAQTVGAIISLCIKNKVPIAYLGFGQEPCKGFSIANFNTLETFLHGILGCSAVK